MPVAGGGEHVITAFHEQLVEDIEQAIKAISSWHVEPVIVTAEAAAIGAGDSYAAALAAEASSNGRVKAYDPSHLSIIGGLRWMVREGRVLLALSVGGRTREVVRVAEEYRRLGGRVVAVTASRESPLAQTASYTALMPYGRTVRGIGAGRHLAMLATLAKVLGGEAVEAPSKCTARISLGEPAAHIGLGDSYSTSVFAALKTYEVFGLNSRYVFLEQLLHAELYSVPRRIYIYEPAQPLFDERIEEAIGLLEEAGYEVIVVKRLSGNPWRNAFAQQYCVLKSLAGEVKERGVEKPFYRGHAAVERVARLIYYS